MKTTLALLAGGLAPGIGLPAALDAGNFQQHLRVLEIGVKGRLGVHVLDTGSGQEYGYRSDERFMMLSSFKLLASALVLHRVDAGKESLDRRIAFTQSDLVAWSPVTEKHAGGEGLSLGELCAATIATSDNTAANLILASYGGPATLTAYVRQLGDRLTRFDRIEPALNSRGGDPEMDTTTPRAMLHSMRQVLLGDALSEASRRQLQGWLLANTTGGKRLKAGLPARWKIGDKTGTSQTDTNDIGVIWPPQRAPLLVTAYLADSGVSAELRDAAFAALGELLVALSGTLSIIERDGAH